MYERELQLIGLSPNEAKIYESLLRTGETSVTEVANESKVHRRSVYDTLMRLIEKGLVFQIIEKKENLYRAVDPKKCMELMKEKEKAFKKILPGLEYFYRSEPIEEAVHIYRGKEGYKNYVRDLMRVGEDTYFLGAKFNWATPGTEGLLRQYKAEMKKNKKQALTIFDPRVQDVFKKSEYNKVGGEYKFLPEGFETPGVMDVFGDHVVTFNSVDIGNFGDDGSIFVMVNKQLAESYRTWFRFIWETLPNVK